MLRELAIMDCSDHGLVLEAETAALIVYQTPTAALVPSCFEWRETAGSLQEVACLR